MERNLRIDNVTLIEPADGSRTFGSLVIRGGTICGAPDVGEHLPAVDGRGLFAIPGLIDMHVHATIDHRAVASHTGPAGMSTLRTLLAVANLATALHSGITSVRDLGASGDSAYAIRAAWSRTQFIGAQPFVAGPVITSVGGHGAWLGQESESPETIGPLVRRNIANGSDVIKLMMRSATRRVELRPEELVRAIAEAHWHDIPVAVHANFTERSIDTAVNAGCDTLEHGFSISDSTAAAMHDQHIALCPTTVALQAITEHANEWRRRGAGELVARAAEQLPEARLSFERAVDAGVEIIAGTDAGVTGVGFDSLARELQSLAQWGLSPARVLAAATSAAAEALRHPELGTLAPDTPADVVLLSRDPLIDGTAYSAVEAVVQGGALVRLNSLGRSAGAGVQHAPGMVMPY